MRSRLGSFRPQKLIAELTAGSLLAMVAVAGVADTASAAGPLNPWTTFTLTKTADGTGHGTSDATFVNTANGFHPGDDTPHDGVVSSRDTVQFQVDVQFKASVARSVTFALDHGTALDWPATGDQFCKSGLFVKATREGNTCTFDVPAGAVERFSAPLLLVAQDTGGVTVPGQRLTIDVSANGTGVYSTTVSPPVTVVSAPASDVYVTSNQSYEDSLTYALPTKAWTTSQQSGYFWATPLPLQYPAYSATKGVSTAGQWWGTFDVSSMPAGTTFLVGGVAQAPANGLLTIPKSTGAVRIDYTVPGWPAATPGGQCADPAVDPDTGEVAPGCWGANETNDFPVRVNVDPASFSTPGGMVNNGGRPGDPETGWQPGDGDAVGKTTADPNIGSQAGKPYPNNDWTTVRVTRYWTPPPPVGDLPMIHKTIQAPTDTTRSVWDARNMTADSGSPLADRQYTGTPSHMGAAPGTELTSVLSTTTGDHIWNETGDPPTPAGNPENGTRFTLKRMVFGDTWDNREQTLDPTREITLSASLAAVGVPGAHVIQWSTDTKTHQQIGNPDDAGWTTGWPTDPDVAATARSVRVIVDATEGAPFKPHTGYSVSVPLRLADQGALATYADEKGLTGPETAYDGRAVQNTAALHAIADNGHAEASAFPRTILVRLQRQAAVVIDHTSDAPGKNADGNVPVGEPIDFTISPAVRNIADATSGVVHPVVVVELDKCLVTPVNTSSEWKMQITPARAGDDGRVCDSTDPHTPEEGGPRGAILTFTPAFGDTTPVTWTDLSQGRGTLPTITYTAAPGLSMLAGNKVTSVATITLNPALDNVPDPASAPTSQTVAARATDAAHLAADVEMVDVSESLSWTWQVFSKSPLLSQAQNSTVLILPFMGDGVIYEDAIGKGLFGAADYEATGRAQASDFHGSYTLTDLQFSIEDTSARAHMYYTIDQVTDLDPAAPANWLPVDGADKAHLAQARAIKVVMEPVSSPETSTAKVHITLQPTGNHRDDVYVLWPSTTAITGEPGASSEPADATQDDLRHVPAPYPDDIQVVASTITGTVWWDPNADGSIDGDEEGIKGVEVTLHRVGSDGKPGEPPVKSTATNDDGAYTFDNLHSGRYVTVVHRGTAIPDVTSHYNTALPADQTYSFRNKYGPASTETSTVIDLGVGAVQEQVDFGFRNPDPRVAIDKSPASVTCEKGLCTAAWDVTITNTGNEPITDGVFYDRLSPAGTSVEVRGVTYDDSMMATAVSAGLGYSMALDRDGSLWAWGQHDKGRLGNGTTNGSTHSPAKVAALANTRIIGMSPGDEHALALAEDGSVWAWGVNRNGGLGDGTTTETARTTPGQVLNLDRRIAAVSTMNYASLALADDGTVWAWGFNAYGQLGIGSTTPSVPLPTQVRTPTGTKIVTLDGGANHALALDDDGAVWAWGNNTYGQLGNGQTSNSTVPFKVRSQLWLDRKFIAVSAGGTHSLALASDGTVWAWGRNSSGQVGIGTSGTNDNRSTPQQVIGLDGKTIVAISAGDATSFALAADGTVWAWGTNSDGVLALGQDAAVRSSPVEVEALASKGITAVASTFQHSTAVAEDGTVWAWGSNNSGRLGDGTTTNRLTPVKAGDFGRRSIPGAILTPISIDEADGLVTRAFRVQTMQPDEARTFQVTATYLQPAAPHGDKVVVNQAWVDSPLTPYAGLHGQPRPTPVEVPSAEAMNALGVPGNETCNTDADTTGQDPEDSCDQVPAKLPPSPTEPGALSGVAWVDSDPDGLRDDDELLLPGVTVRLERNGAVYGDTETDEHGTYRFEGLSPGNDYQVQFGISHLDPDGGEDVTTFAFVPANVGNPVDYRPTDPESRDSDAHQQTGLTEQLFTVVAGKETRHVDAGVQIHGPALSVVKTSKLGDPVTVEVPEGKESDSMEVSFTVTNEGDEPLIDIGWVDKTTAGPEIPGFVCTPALVGLTLAPQQSVTCTGTLPGMPAGDTHSDTVTVTARGQSTKRLVWDDDPFTVEVKQKPWQPPVIALPAIGGHRDVIGVVAAVLTVTLLAGLAVRRAVRRRVGTLELEE